MKRFFYLLSFAAILAGCASPEGQEVESSAAIDEETEGTEMVASAQYVVDPATSVDGL